MERAKKKRKVPDTAPAGEAAGSGGGAAAPGAARAPDPQDRQGAAPQPAAVAGSGALDPQQARLEQEVEGLAGGFRASGKGLGGGSSS
eukprot:9173501-Pyramimonas_sp.AAC.1